MDELEKKIVAEYVKLQETWITAIREAEEKGEGIDLNLGGSFASGMQNIISALREFKIRAKKNKKSMW